MSLLLAAKTASMSAARVAPTAPVARAAMARYLSSHGTVALDKLRNVFEEYRVQNFTMETPARFRKELMKAADKNNDGNIPIDGIEGLLMNIGAAGRISRSEIETLLSEVGDASNMTIPTDRMMKMI